MELLPQDVETYRRTPTFTENTVPRGLLSDHRTKTGVWGLLTVETGKLVYSITEPGWEEEIEVRPGFPAVIAPAHRHYVRPVGTVRFHVQFLK